MFISWIFISSNVLAQIPAGQVAPKFIQTGYDGKLVSIGEVKSKIILIDFWASWCAPCIKSTKTVLIPLYNSYDRVDVDIIGISNDRTEEKWRAAIHKYQMTWSNIWDADKSLVRAYGVPFIPTYFILDNQGIILKSNVYSNDLKHEVKKALELVNNRN
jgi:peroxiredoxin